MLHGFSRTSLLLPLLACWATLPACGQTKPPNTELRQQAANSSRLEGASQKEREEYFELLMVLADTIDQIDRNYVEKVSRRELIEAAIDGAVKKLDAYSDYIPPEELDDFKVEVENEFAGLGIQISSRAGQLRVISPLVGTPAYKAGIQPGDLILKINETPTKGLSISDAVKLMKGRPGTTVDLDIYHAIKQSEERLTLTREIIKVETVLGDHRLADDNWSYWLDQEQKIGYARLTTFGRETAPDLAKVLTELEEKDARAFVLDLRFNPGGLLRSAIEVADMFLDSGKIVTMEGRNVERQEWQATKAATLTDLPLVVVVNQYSASASEIVSAALQDHNRAVIIGEQTFGKASVQNVVELEAGKSAIKITTGSYQRPSGKSIHRFTDSTEWGVKPDPGFRVPLSNFELGRILRMRQQRNLADGANTDEPPNRFDPQLKKTIEYLRKQLG